MPVPVIEDRARLRGLVLQVLGRDRERTDESVAVRDPETVAVEVREHPLVRVEAIAVGEIEPVVHSPELGAERGRPRHGRVDVEPDAFVATDPSDLGHRVDRVRRSRPHRRADEAGQLSGAAVLRDPSRERVRPHREAVVDVDQSQVLRFDRRSFYCSINVPDRGVSLGRRVRHETSVGADLVRTETGRPLSPRQQRAQGRARGGVLDDAAPGLLRAELRRQAEHPDQPVENVGLELRAGRTGRPEHALDAQARGKELAQNRRTRVVRGEVREEVRRLPVRDPGQDQPVHVGEHRVEGLPFRRGIRRKLRANLARPGAREDREALDPVHVVRDPVHGRAAVASELIGRHVNPGRIGRVGHDFAARGGFTPTRWSREAWT